MASATNLPELFFSEYLEGGTGNFAKALEIFNGTGGPVDLSAGQYTVNFYTNGSPIPSGSISLTGTVANGDVFVLANPTSAAAVLTAADQTSALLNFNGNDALVLTHAGTAIDVIGQIGFDPGAFGWGTAPTTTVDHDLVRSSLVDVGDTNASDLFDPSVQWVSFPDPTYSNLGSHTNDDFSSGSGGGGGSGADTGTVGAQVTVPSSAACLEVSTTSVDFGTLPLGSDDQPATPDITVTNCSGLESTVYARGTDATGAGGAHWSLTSTLDTCAGSLGLDVYGLKLEQGGGETVLVTDNNSVTTLASGASDTRTARIDTACPGSSGAGTTMSMQIVYLATTGG